MLVLLALCFGQELDANATRKWMYAVEEVLSAVSLGPLKAEFIPSYIARRTFASVIAAQTARFRARAARALFEATGTRVIVCIDETATTSEAVEAVREELVKHEFDAFVAKAHPSCPGAKKSQDALLVDNLPPPTSSE